MKTAKKSAKSKARAKPAARSVVKKSASKKSIRAPAPIVPVFFIGQVELFAFSFAPANWLPCDGRLLAISQNAALFSLLGTNYGGDGRVTFGLPKLIPPDPDGPNYFIAVQGAFPNR